MAVSAKDGSMHHSAGRASLHNEMHSSKAPVKEMSKPKGDGEGKSSMSIEEHVKTHGPAHTMNHVHDKKTNRHHVHTVHGEGMMHKSEHASADEAHAHMGKALGLGGENEEQNETPDDAEEAYETQHSGGGIPGMS